MIALPRDEVIRLYAHLRQAERSMHRALNAPWAELLAYYRLERLEALRSVLHDLEAKLHEQGTPIDATGETIAPNLPRPSIFCHFFGRWLSWRRKSWAFSVREIRFMLATMRRLLTFLQTPVKPSAGDLIALRMDLCFGEGIIEIRCHGLAALVLARHVEHFQQTEWLPSVRVDELLGPSAGPVQTAMPRKHSA